MRWPGTSTLYGHLEPKLVVQVGDSVSAGQPIGTVGVTGFTTGPTSGEASATGRAAQGGGAVGLSSSSAMSATASAL